MGTVPYAFRETRPEDATEFRWAVVHLTITAIDSFSFSDLHFSVRLNAALTLAEGVQLQGVLMNGD